MSRKYEGFLEFEQVAFLPGYLSWLRGVGNREDVVEVYHVRI